ncbi:MAG TPA: DUF2911 domain-containing protein [Vicinamibacterales bacterium]|jgi:hypothetical protein|nr:DUF2911 domain-containing protein [Vicinamibacterales bacterium]
MISKRMLAVTCAAAVGAGAAVVSAQTRRPASPSGASATQVGGHYETRPGADEPVYVGGKWIEITYGRPIKRERDLWGAGADYGKTLNGGAPVWRAGANVTTRLKTEVPLVIGGKTVPAGEYSVFIDLKPNNWTLILSSWPHQTRYDPSNKEALWGAFGYTPDRDVARAPMKLGTLPVALDEMSWEFADMTAGGGTLTFLWDKTIATVPFKIGS